MLKLEAIIPCIVASLDFSDIIKNSIPMHRAPIPVINHPQKAFTPKGYSIVAQVNEPDPTQFPIIADTAFTKASDIKTLYVPFVCIANRADRE